MTHCLNEVVLRLPMPAGGWYDIEYQDVRSVEALGRTLRHLQQKRWVTAAMQNLLRMLAAEQEVLYARD